MSFLKRHTAPDGSSKPASSVDAEFQTMYPALHEYLTAGAYPDGSPRVRSTLTVFSEDGYWKACLNEKDQGLVMFVAESRFGSLVEALELLLQEESPPWRKSAAKGRPGPGKKGASS